MMMPALLQLITLITIILVIVTTIFYLSEIVLLMFLLLLSRFTMISRHMATILQDTQGLRFLLTVGDISVRRTTAIKLILLSIPQVSNLAILVSDLILICAFLALLYCCFLRSRGIYEYYRKS